MARSFGTRTFNLTAVMASLSRIEIDVAGRKVPAACLRIAPGQAALWFAGLAFCDDDLLSPSLQWFRSLTLLAENTVDAGRVRPRLVRLTPSHPRMGGPLLHARWRLVDGPDIDDAVLTLAAAAPTAALPTLTTPTTVTPTTATPTTVTPTTVTPTTVTPVAETLMTAALPATRAALTREVLEDFVDGIARTRLHSSGWKPPLQGLRNPEAQAARGMFTALAKADPLVRAGNAAFLDALAALAMDLEREARRAAGEPVVSVRLRLVLPDDGDEDWPLGLEVVDEDGRWCTASDLTDRTPLATEVAGSVDHLPMLDGLVARVARSLAADLPVLAPLAAPSADGRVLLEIDQVAELLQVAPPVLHRLGIELLGPEALVKASPSVRGAARPTAGGERAAGLTAAALVDWSVEVTADDRSLAGNVTDEELARAAAAGVALLQVGGRWVQLDGAQLRKARKAVDQHRGAHSEVDALTLLRLAAESGEGDIDTIVEVESIDDDSRTAEMWLGDLLQGLPDEQLTETEEPPGFVGELRHYQRRGLSWLQFLARVGLGGVLADDMGLGKTATTLAHLLTRPGPHLVVCPLSVVRNWQTEAARFAPSLDVRVHHGADRHRGEQVEEALADADIVITTYGLIARDAQHLAEIAWTTMVLDEAQMVKNPATRAAKGVRHVPAVQKIALTGTPVENHLTELWAILDAVNPGMLGGQRRFRDRYARPIERDGDVEVAERLRALTQPFVLRRTKADKRLLPDLPDKIEQIAWAELSKEQAALYKGVVEQLLADAEREKGMKRRGLVLAALTRLKQICNHPAHVLGDGSKLAGRSGKLDRFDELVDELLEADERALVFTQFREMGELLQRHLAERLEMRVPFLHGGVTRGRRDAMVDDFQSGVGSPLLLVSLKAGGTGLNLTAATRVIHYDRWWNPAVEDQASDRAWRIGQTQTVFVHKLVCSGTVEEKIAALIDDKKALADAVVGSGEAWLSELDTDDLRDLVMLELGS
jgi:hypothetical protein